MIKQLIEDLGHDPTSIGIAILRQNGYVVKTFEYSPDIFVYDSTGEQLLYKYVGSDYYHE